MTKEQIINKLYNSSRDVKCKRCGKKLENVYPKHEFFTENRDIFLQIPLLIGILVERGWHVCRPAGAIGGGDYVCQDCYHEGENEVLPIKVVTDDWLPRYHQFVENEET